MIDDQAREPHLQLAARDASRRENRRSWVRVFLTYLFAAAYIVFAFGLAIVLVLPSYGVLSRLESQDLQTLLGLFAGVSAASLGIIGYWFGNRDLTKGQAEIADTLLRAHKQMEGVEAQDASALASSALGPDRVLNETPPDLLLKAYEKAVEDLLDGGHPDVTGVTVGYKYKDGKRTDQKLLRLHVRKKVSDENLLKGRKLPQMIAGVPVDVVETALIIPQARLDATADQLTCREIRGVQPLVQPGVNIGLAGADGSEGTLGALVWDLTDNRLAALTAAHVLPIPEYTNVTHPGMHPTASHKIGNVKRSNKDVDAALIELTIANHSANIFGLELPFTAMADPVVGQHVNKIGAVTGLTRGKVDGCGRFTEDITGGLTAPVACIVSDPIFPTECQITMRGDSGSVWFRELSEGEIIAVALHVRFAWVNKVVPTAIAVYMPYALGALDAKLVKATP